MENNDITRAYFLLKIVHLSGGVPEAQRLRAMALAALRDMPEPEVVAHVDEEDETQVKMDLSGKPMERR